MISYAGLSLLNVRLSATPPLWVAYLRFVIAVILIVLGIYLLRRGRGRAVAMAHAASPGEIINAAPQLPGWIRAVDTLHPGALGMARLRHLYPQSGRHFRGILAMLDETLRPSPTTRGSRRSAPSRSLPFSRLQSR